MLNKKHPIAKRSLTKKENPPRNLVFVCFQKKLYDLQIGYKPGRDLFDPDALSGATYKYKAR